MQTNVHYHIVPFHAGHINIPEHVAKSSNKGVYLRLCKGNGITCYPPKKKHGACKRVLLEDNCQKPSEGFRLFLLVPLVKISWVPC